MKEYMKEYRSPTVTGRRTGNSYSIAFTVVQAINAMLKPDPDPKPFSSIVSSIALAVTDIASAGGALEPCLD
ncbi:MAG: hypothetical protein IKQ95_01490 [Synergistaceae bacterium]|nr:hypothetical protein [Synergistaceae bacterium]